MLNTARSDLRFFAQKILQACLGVRPTGSCKPRRNFSFRPRCETSLNIIEKYWRPATGRYTSFAPRDNPRPVKKKNGHVAFFHWSWGSLWYQIFTLWLDIASGIRGGENLFFFFTWNQPVVPHYPEWWRSGWLSLPHLIPRAQVGSAHPRIRTQRQLALLE